MKIALYGKKSAALEKLLADKGFEVVKPQDDFRALLLCYGGDGAMLGAELRYPGRLKMPVRDRETAPHCPEHSLESLIDAITSGALKTTRMMKLTGIVGDAQHYALNDIFIHRINKVSALRYRVQVDGEVFAREVVGDGVGVATVHGSTAYYRSITHGCFRVGIGLAFSNSAELLNHLVLSEDSVVKIRILRGPAELVFDNSSDIITLNNSDVVTVRKSDKTAEFLGLEEFMCPKCRRIRRERRIDAFEDVL